MDPAEVVLRFLESVGRRSEAEFYLERFRAQPKERFAAIAIDAEVARQASDAVVLDLRFLAALGLSPTVILGLFQPGESSALAQRLQRRLAREGVRATVLDANEQSLADRVTEAARSGAIPIVAFAASNSINEGESSDFEDRFARLGSLLASLVTRKLIFLRRRGGLRQKGAQLDLVNMTTDFAALVGSRELTPRERALLAQSHRLVFERVPHKLLIAVTSPLELFRELFTVQGAGTLLRRGATVLRRAGFSEVDGERLRGLLSSSFGRTPAESFFARGPFDVYLEEGYRGVAIVGRTALGGYLTKFAVEREAQGEGLGGDIWQVVAEDHPTLFWRARPANPISGWYVRRCEGLVRFPDWTVYWRGLGPRSIPQAIDYAMSQPIDIPPIDPPNEQ